MLPEGTYRLSSVERLVAHSLYLHDAPAKRASRLLRHCAAASSVSTTTVSISTLTVGFVLCFLALRMRTLDIKQVSRYLSHQTGRQKSRLCKLYQIAHILEAAGVITRSEVAGEIVIVEKFFAPVDLKDPAKNPFAIESILNRARPGEEQTLQNRRSDFCAQAGASRLQERTV
jgi:hypothetical protein